MSETATTAPLRHVDMLRLWPVRVHFARDLNAALEARGGRISSTAVQGWEDRDCIPEKYWQAIADLAAAEGRSEVTIESLRAAALSTTRQSRRRGRPKSLPAVSVA